MMRWSSNCRAGSTLLELIANVVIRIVEDKSNGYSNLRANWDWHKFLT